MLGASVHFTALPFLSLPTVEQRPIGSYPSTPMGINPFVLCGDWYSVPPRPLCIPEIKMQIPWHSTSPIPIQPFDEDLLKRRKKNSLNCARLLEKNGSTGKNYFLQLEFIGIACIGG